MAYQTAHREERNVYKGTWAKARRAANVIEARQKEKERRAKGNKAVVAAGNHRFREANPSYWNNWAKAHTEEKRLSYQRWLVNNRHVLKAASKRWRQNNPDAVREHIRRRKMKKVNAAGLSSPEQRQMRFEFYGCSCWMCQRCPAKHMDHVKALCNGGSDWPANLRPACAECNGAKGQWEMNKNPTVPEIVEFAIKRKDFGYPWPPKKVTP